MERAAEVFRNQPQAGSTLRAASDVGLACVLLGDPTNQCSGGEALRFRLAAAVGRGGRTCSLQVLGEPAAGLHLHEAPDLRGGLLRLPGAGNAVVAVGHHRLLVRAADHVVVLRPGPADAGGRAVYEGPPVGMSG